MLTPDFGVAEHFLSRFNYDLTTIQLINDVTKKPGKVAAIKLPFSDSLKAKLTERQNQGFGAFFMVNEGDGIIHEGKKTCRSEDSVIFVRSLFVDTDGQSVTPLEEFLAKHNIIPHAVYQSSPNKFHYYIFLEKEEYPDPAIKSKWQDLQLTLATTGNYDKNMTDVSRVLRIPGLFHQKEKPFQVSLVRESNHEPYNIHEIFTDLKNHEAIQRKSPYIEPLEGIPITPGNRHKEIHSYLGYISSTSDFSRLLLDSPSASEEHLYTHALGFIAKHQKDWPEAKDWLPNGPRNQELRNQVRDIYQRRLKAQIPKEALNGHTLSSPLITNKPTVADSTLFLQSPGLIGALARDLNSRSRERIPQFEYASARSLIGLLKSFNYMTAKARPLPATDYCMCLAPTGRGKSASKDLIEQILIKLGFGSFIVQQIRSAHGLDRELFENNQRLLFVHNEAHHFFNNLKLSREMYLKSITPWFLNMYDAYKQAKTSTGKTGDDSQKSYDNKYAQVGYLGFGVPIALEDLFNATTLAEGTLSRFLVLTADNITIPPLSLNDLNPLIDIDKMPSFSMIKELADNSGELKRVILSNITEFNEEDDEESILRKQKKHARELAILRLEAQDSRKLIKIPFSSDAWRELEIFDASITKLRDSSDNLNSFYSRTLEHVERAALCDVEGDEIKKHHIEYAIQIVMAITNDLRAKIGKNLETGNFGHLYNKVISLLADSHLKTQQAVISEAELLKRFDSSQRRDVKDIIAMAIESEEIKLSENHLRSPSSRRIKRGLTLQNIN